MKIDSMHTKNRARIAVLTLAKSITVLKRWIIRAPPLNHCFGTGSLSALNGEFTVCTEKGLVIVDFIIYFQVVLPSGTIVTVSQGQENGLNVWIAPSAADRSAAKGKASHSFYPILLLYWYQTHSRLCISHSVFISVCPSVVWLLTPFKKWPKSWLPFPICNTNWRIVFLNSKVFWILWISKSNHKIVILSRSSGAGSPKNRLGCRPQRDTGR